MAHVPFPTRLVRIRKLTPLVRELSFEYTETSQTFKTGQFFMMHVPTTVGEGNSITKRAYSMASSHHDDRGFRLLVKLVPGGVASDYIETLKDGQAVEFSGPFGKCFFQMPPLPRILFLCTGAGLAQHYSMLLSEMEHLQDVQAHMLIGVWSPEEMFYVPELDQLRTRLPKFTYEFVLDKPAPGWSGKVGYITQFIDEFGLTATHILNDTLVYLCGNPDMIKGARKLLLEERLYPKDHFIAEAFNHVPGK